MPLVKGTSQKVFVHNIKAEETAGKPQKQSLAIAYSVKRKAQAAKRKKMAKGGEIENDPLEFEQAQEPTEICGAMAAGGDVKKHITRRHLDNATVSLREGDHETAAAHLQKYWKHGGHSEHNTEARAVGDEVNQAYKEFGGRPVADTDEYAKGGETSEDIAFKGEAGHVSDDHFTSRKTFNEGNPNRHARIAAYQSHHRLAQAARDAGSEDSAKFHEAEKEKHRKILGFSKGGKVQKDDGFSHTDEELDTVRARTTRMAVGLEF